MTPLDSVNKHIKTF